MDDTEYAVWSKATAEKINTKMGPVRDEVIEIREKMGYDTYVPKIELEMYTTPEAAKFWREVEDMRYGTIWNQPKVGDLVTLGHNPGVITELVQDGDAVTQVYVQFVTKEKTFSMMVEPWKLVKTNV